MWSAKICGNNAKNPLEWYHEAVRSHEELVGPELEQLRREVEARLDELKRKERRHLSRQRKALSALREQLRRDARFVLRSLRFSVFAENLSKASSRLPSPLRVSLPRDPASWSLGALPLPVAVVRCESEQEEDYEDEHDCLRDVLSLGLRVGSAPVDASLERGRRSLSGGHSEVPLVYQHQELSLQLYEPLVALDLGEQATRSLCHEVAAVALYAAPILLEEPSGVSFSYP